MSQISDDSCPIQLLPNEILEQILSNKFITYYDLCQFSVASKRFYHLIKDNNKIWKNKFVNKWNQLLNNKCFINNIDTEVQSLSHFWHKLVVERHRIGCDVRNEVRKLIELHYFDDELSNDSFESFVNMGKYYDCNETHFKLFQIDELQIILNDEMRDKNLTIKYYALKVLTFLRHQLLREQWIKYLENNQNSNDLFYGALLISSWFQLSHTLNEEHYRKQIELMAQLTIHEIGLRYKNNSLIKDNFGQCLTDFEANNLLDSKWSSDNCKQILLCLNEVLFNQLRFAANHHNFYDSSNSFIDKVIDNRLGIPITLCILYQSIAAKLGVKTYGVNFPHHFIIKWKHFESESESDKYTYIDVYENGRFLNDNSSLFQNYEITDVESLGVCKSIDVFRRMCRNLIEIGRQQEVSSEGLLCLRNALELLCILSPEDTEPRLLLSRVYLHLNINLEEVNEMLLRISEKDPTSIGVVMFLRQSVISQLSAKKCNHHNNNNTRRNSVKTRNKNDNILYSIGMIMSHKKYNYTCVIYGWDAKCAASRDWIYQMGVYSLPNKDKQPFYNVLVEDGSTRYAAQENLEPSKEPIEIKHPEVGKYFREFSKTHYLPNSQKVAEYPDDESALNNFLVSQLQQRIY